MNVESRFYEYQHCPKCGYNYLDVRYCEGDDPTCTVVTDLPSHLHIECERCSYQWAQKPVDTGDA